MRISYIIGGNLVQITGRQNTRTIDSAGRMVFLVRGAMYSLACMSRSRLLKFEPVAEAGLVMPLQKSQRAWIKGEILMLGRSILSSLISSSSSSIALPVIHPSNSLPSSSP